MGWLMLFKTIICLLCAIFLYATPVAAKTYTIMVFGDSLSAGYGLKKNESFAAQLSVALKDNGYPNIQVINSSKSGGTTADGLKRQSKALRQKPDIVLLELGINDVLKGVAVETIEDNLSALIQNFQKNKAAVFLAGMKAPPITEIQYANRFFNMYADLAKRYHTGYYPFFMQGLFKAAGNDYASAAPYLLADNAHPNNSGVALMVKDILPALLAFLKQQGIQAN